MATALTDLDVRVSLTDALSDLIAAYEVSGHSPRTNSLYKTHIEKMIAFLANDGIVTLDGVTTSSVTRYLASEQKRGLKPASLHIALRTIRTFFNVCIEQGHLTVNPAKAVKAPRIVLEPPQFLSDVEINALLAAAAKDKTVEGVRDGAFIRVLRDTGIRRGELIALRVTDWDETERTLVIDAATSKGRRGRTVPLSKDTATALRTYLRVRTAYLTRLKRTDSGALWVASKGDLSGNGALQAFWGRCDDAGVTRRSLHQFRHRWTATGFEKNLPLPYIVQLGGWADATMPTTRYGMFGVKERAITAMRDLLDA